MCIMFFLNFTLFQNQFWASYLEFYLGSDLNFSIMIMGRWFLFFHLNHTHSSYFCYPQSSMNQDLFYEYDPSSKIYSQSWQWLFWQRYLQQRYLALYFILDHCIQIINSPWSKACNLDASFQLLIQLLQYQSLNSLK